MVDKGVQFDDARREFEKRFIARVLQQCDGSLGKAADAARHPPQHARRKMAEYRIKTRP